jgi:hypothetical protein
MPGFALAVTPEEALLAGAREKITAACRVFGREVPSVLTSVLEQNLASVRVQPLPDDVLGGLPSVVFSIPQVTGLSGEITVGFAGKFGPNVITTITFKLVGFETVFYWVPGEGWSRN